LGNRDTLLSEGVYRESVFVTGNPVVDSLKAILKGTSISPAIERVLNATAGLKRVILTTHRRESFGEQMAENLGVLRSFVESHSDIALIFPVHPNPAVMAPAHDILSGCPRIHLIEPLNYHDFIFLLSRAWLIVSDSGGVQEEAPTLGKPLLVLRENTERLEGVKLGFARLVGGCPGRLVMMLEGVLKDGDWANEIRKLENPFGRGDSGKRIAQIVVDLLHGQAHEEQQLAR